MAASASCSGITPAREKARESQSPPVPEALTRAASNQRGAFWGRGTQLSYLTGAEQSKFLEGLTVRMREVLAESGAKVVH